MGKASKGYTNQSMVGNYGAHSKVTYHDHGRYGQKRFMVGQRNGTRERPERPSRLIKLTEKDKQNA